MNNNKQDFKCFIGLHRYEVIENIDIKNPYNAVVGHAIVNRCTHCGIIKEYPIYTDSHYKRIIL